MDVSGERAEAGNGTVSDAGGANGAGGEDDDPLDAFMTGLHAPAVTQVMGLGVLTATDDVTMEDMHMGVLSFALAACCTMITR